MSGTIDLKSDRNCANCDIELESNFKFCPACGQTTEKEESLKSFFSHFMSDYFTFDSKIGRSIAPLLSRPGFLTEEYLRGKIVHYIPPLRLFLFTSIIFFLLFSWLDNKILLEGNDLDSQFWDSFFESRLPKLFFLLLPIFALIISLLYRKSVKSQLPHFLFAFHFHSTVFLAGIIYELISWCFSKVGWQEFNVYLLILFTLYLATYLWKSLRYVYKQDRKKTAWKYLVLIGLYSICVIVSSLILLFFIL